jgi:hypothetical protein
MRAALGSLIRWSRAPGLPHSDVEKEPLFLSAAAGLYAAQNYLSAGRETARMFNPITDCPVALLSVGDVLREGAAKYPDRNWEHGMKYSRVIAAAERHALAFIGGEVLDPETRLLHVSHFNCCTMFLLTYEARKMGEKWDDRQSLAGGAA